MAKRTVYADNTATTQMSQAAIDTMIQYLNKDYGNASQPYSFSRTSRKALKEARCIIADCIGADSDEIYFTSGGTESDNWVIHNAIEQKLNIITSQIEHHAILNPCKYAQEHGADVSYIRVNRDGLVVASDIKNSSSSRCFVSVMMANNEIGTIQDIKKLKQVAGNALFHTDAVQAIGHIDVNVKELAVDFLSASGHKFNGPKGVGFLYARKGVKLSPLILGGAQELGQRAGTENVASIMAMAIALRENVEKIEETRLYLSDLEHVILDELNSNNIDYIRNGINHLPGLLSLSFKNMNGESILHRLDLNGICVSTGSACDSQNTQVSHVLEACGIPLEYAKGTIRISLSKSNTYEEVQYIAEKLIRIVKQ